MTTCTIIRHIYIPSMLLIRDFYWGGESVINDNYGRYLGETHHQRKWNAIMRAIPATQSVKHPLSTRQCTCVLNDTPPLVRRRFTLKSHLREAVFVSAKKNTRNLFAPQASDYIKCPIGFSNDQVYLYINTVNIKDRPPGSNARILLAIKNRGSAADDGMPSSRESEHHKLTELHTRTYTVRRRCLHHYPFVDTH